MTAIPEGIAMFPMELNIQPYSAAELSEIRAFIDGTEAHGLQALFEQPPVATGTAGLEDILAGLSSGGTAPTRDVLEGIRNLVADVTTTSEQGAKDVRWGLKNLEWALNNVDRASRARFDHTAERYEGLTQRQIDRAIKYVERGIAD
jgi:hypothetical protein